MLSVAVLHAGFATTKGELVRSIMFPKPTDFKFSQDAYKFIGVLFLISAIGMVYTYVIMVSETTGACSLFSFLQSVPVHSTDGKPSW